MSIQLLAAQQGRSLLLERFFVLRKCYITSAIDVGSLARPICPKAEIVGQICRDLAESRKWSDLLLRCVYIRVSTDNGRNPSLMYLLQVILRNTRKLSLIEETFHWCLTNVRKAPWWSWLLKSATKYTHKYSLNLGKNEKIEIFENLFQIESLGSGFSQTIKRPKRQ